MVDGKWTNETEMESLCNIDRIYAIERFNLLQADNLKTDFKLEVCQSQEPKIKRRVLG